MNIIKFIAIFSFAYTIGSINVSIVLFKLLGKQDPRTQYSKNPGVTNVYRQAGPFWAAIVLILDVGKAICISLLSTRFLPVEAIAFIGFGLILGNRYPCFHGFAGGKGVAAYLGFASVITPVFTLFSILAWFIIFAIFGLPFISSFVMVLILSIGCAASFDWNPVAIFGFLFLTLFIYYNHKTNIIEFSEKI